MKVDWEYKEDIVDNNDKYDISQNNIINFEGVKITWSENCLNDFK